MKIVKCPYCNQDIVDNNGIWISGEYLCPNCYKNEKNEITAMNLLEGLVQEDKGESQVCNALRDIDEDLFLGYNEFKSDIEHAIEIVLKALKRYKNMYHAEHQIHLVRNEQLSRKEKAVLKAQQLENENKELKEIVEEAIVTCFSEYNDDTEILCRKLVKYGYIGFDEKEREYINPLVEDDRDILEKKREGTIK